MQCPNQLKTNTLRLSEDLVDQGLQNPSKRPPGATDFLVADRARFWRKVNKAGPAASATLGACWIWTGCKNRRGYGAFQHSKRSLAAHRVSFVLAFGGNWPDLFVCHKCDNPPCCNPGHLFLGSALDNNLDMKRKGRCATGDKNGSHRHPEKRARGNRNGARLYPERLSRGTARYNAKLTPDAVAEIRQSIQSKTSTHRVLARQYGVSPSAISAVANGRNWAIRSVLSSLKTIAGNLQ